MHKAFIRLQKGKVLEGMGHCGFCCCDWAYFRWAAFLNSGWLLHILAASTFRGLSLLGSSSSDWIDSSTVLTLYAALQVSYR